MPRIRQADVDEVKVRTNIADIIGERVALKPAGVGSLKGLCPFHDEKSPSFHVRPQHGFYHCFGCGESGDVYTFLREMDHMTFTEAVEKLAARVGVTLHYEEGGGVPAEERSGRARLFAANTAAAEFFRAQLVTPEAQTARGFLGQRGFDAPAAAHFGVGYAPRGWDGMLKSLTSAGFTHDELTAAGLVSTNQRGGVYDRFRGRVIWPIRDVTGQTIGFGARKLYDDDQGPKYLNTPETPVYKKSQVLYGLDLAKRDISRGDPRRVVVVEGYTDVMACHLAGVATAIATCGTAFGADHVQVLRRVMGDTGTGEVVFTFDGDAAGQKAAMRAFTDAKSFTAQTFVAVAPDGLDPCDLRLQRGDAAVRALIDHRVPMFEFVLDTEIKRFDLSTVEGRVAAMRQAAPVVADIRDRLLRGEYERVLARKLGLDPADVHREVEHAARRGSARGAPPVHQAPADEPVAEPIVKVTLGSLPRTPDTALERDALTGILQFGHRVDPELMHRAVNLPFRTPPLEAVRQSIAETDWSKIGWAAAAVDATREPYRSLAAALLTRDFPAVDEEQAAQSTTGLCRRIVLRSLDAQKNELLGAVQRSDPNSDEGRALRVRLRDLDAERRRLQDS
ncbi:MAG: DNA primase [Microbacterium sp.]